jgi:hypothetical protein
MGMCVRSAVLLLTDWNSQPVTTALYARDPNFFPAKRLSGLTCTVFLSHPTPNHHRHSSTNSPQIAIHYHSHTKIEVI